VGHVILHLYGGAHHVNFLTTNVTWIGPVIQDGKMEYDYVVLAIMLAYMVLLHFLCYKNYEDRGTDPDPPELWVPIGYYNNDTLYEQSFANGKKAWRFKDGDMVVLRRAKK
jgi:hypothetical protein